MSENSNLTFVVAELDARIRAERENLRVQVEAYTDRIAALLIRRAKLVDALGEIGGAGEAVPQSTGPARRQITASDAVLAALKEAGPSGLSGNELNTKISLAGLGSAAGDKAKTRLRAGEKIKLEGGRWLMAQVGQKAKVQSRSAKKAPEPK